MEGRGEVLILSSNNYLGLCAEPSVVEAGIDGLHRFGAGTGSVRFICGTFSIHREIEQALARFVGTEASMSFVSAWNANEGLTATVVEASDFVCSDALNHASIIDSIRLAKAITKCQTAVYKHADMDDLRAKLEAAKGAKRRIVWSDGIFSMEGSIAPLPTSFRSAATTTRSSHSTTRMPRVSLVRRAVALLSTSAYSAKSTSSSTLGKALGGAAGGFVAGSAALCDYLTQRSRPQLFSNALPPRCRDECVGRSAVHRTEPSRVQQLRDNTKYFRERIVEAGFKPLRRDTDHPDHRRRDGDGNPDERPATCRRRVRHRLRLSSGAAGRGPRTVPGVRRTHKGRPRRSDQGIHQSREAAEDRMTACECKQAGFL
jgi:glycine C-acetyltransferase